MARFFLPLCCFLFIAILFSSCANTKKVIYFNNVKDATFTSENMQKQYPLEPNDILSITISSLNAEASAPFNLQNNYISRATTVTGSNNESGGYLVSPDGTIDMPILGTIKAAGLTQSQLKENITNLILSKKLLVDPIVDIRYLNFEVTVLGEVAKPTVITVPSEKISLLKALGLAGDLTIYGRRDNVLLIRQEDGKRITRHIDLNSSNFFDSPYYYLQPNDVIYVEPNKQKAAIARRNPNILPIVLSAISVISLFLIYSNKL
ncbi:MAG TPA: polysaccharide biosynthesis/export family protein [Hanamia sp.]|nr:polysaccharide biosynthesis/export family protein [Hanamia sp.]